MKLQTKINYRFLFLLVLVFLVAGVTLYFVLGLAVNQKFDTMLQTRSEAVKQSLSVDSSIDLVAPSSDKSISITPYPLNANFEEFSDTLISDRNEADLDNYRQMIFGAQFKGQHYKVKLLLSKYETEDLIELIFYFMLALFVFIVLILYFLNRWLSSSLWTPFYKTLDQLNSFKLDHNSNVLLESTDVQEFEQLNESLQLMMQKIQSDFNNLKEFTENASHEIQTPIAIIKSKLENVLQDKLLETKQYKQIQLVYESANRLSKLNEALLLLSKIENQQFPDIKEINLCDLIQQRLEFIEELIDFKKIEIVFTIEQPICVKMNAYLAEILMNNLLGNAVKHNVKGGRITIYSTVNKLVISNTGKPLTIPTEKLFQRFTKQNTGNESTGLGLAIAFEICSKSGLHLQYNYHNEEHDLILNKDVE